MYIPASLASDIGHTDQSSLRKRHVEERGTGGEGCAQADLLHQQKWSDGPELIERQDEWKHLLELFAQPLVVESDGGEKVTAKRDSDSRCHHYGSC